MVIVKIAKADEKDDLFFSKIAIERIKRGTRINAGMGAIGSARNSPETYRIFAKNGINHQADKQKVNPRCFSNG